MNRQTKQTVKDIHPASYNPRRITDKQLAMLKKSMAEFGDLSGIVVNVRTGNLVGGHQRVKNLDPSWPIEKHPATDKTGTVALGYIETPWGRWQYREVDWPEKKEAAANIAANQHGGDFDMPKLKDMIIALDTGDMDMELIGFNSHELELMMTATFQGSEQPNCPAGDKDSGSSGGGEFSPSLMKEPLIINLSATEKAEWDQAKEKAKLVDDKALLLKMARKFLKEV